MEQCNACNPEKCITLIWAYPISDSDFLNTLYYLREQLLVRVFRPGHPGVLARKTMQDGKSEWRMVTCSCFEEGFQGARYR